MSDISTKATSAEGPAPRRTRRRLWITLAIVGAVVAVLATSGMAWHRNPSFCNAVCHAPMDSYVQGYHSSDGALLITKHASGDNALECLDCHKSKVGEQVTEASHWASGDYADPLTKRDFGTRANCLSSGCHDETKIVSATANWGGESGYNPHNPRHGKLQCGACHSMHGASTLACNSCHSLKLPAGWEQPAKPGTPSN